MIVGLIFVFSGYIIIFTSLIVAFIYLYKTKNFVRIIFLDGLQVLDIFFKVFLIPFLDLINQATLTARSFIDSGIGDIKKGETFITGLFENLKSFLNKIINDLVLDIPKVIGYVRDLIIEIEKLI